MNEINNYYQFSVKQFLSNFSLIANQQKSCFKLQLKDLQNYCNLKKILKKKIKDLSPGQTKRVMISLALLNYPDLIILENPFQGLDHFTKDKIIFYLNKLINNGASIILTSTQVNGLENLCTRFILINDKDIIQQGSLNELQDKLNFKFELDIILKVSQEVIQNKKILIEQKNKLKIKANNFEKIIKLLGFSKLIECLQILNEKEELKHTRLQDKIEDNFDNEEVKQNEKTSLGTIKQMKKRIERDELVFIDQFIEWALIENAILELQDKLNYQEKLGNQDELKSRFSVKILRRVGRNVVFQLSSRSQSFMDSQEKKDLMELMKNRQQYFITDYSLGYPSLETIVMDHCLKGEKIKRQQPTLNLN